MILARNGWLLQCNGLSPNTISGFHHGRYAAQNNLDPVTTLRQQITPRRLCWAIFLDIKGGFNNVQRDATMTALATSGLGG